MVAIKDHLPDRIASAFQQGWYHEAGTTVCENTITSHDKQHLTACFNSKTHR